MERRSPDTKENGNVHIKRCQMFSVRTELMYQSSRHKSYWRGGLDEIKLK